jgi:TetR/AcrR family fatty acid metabolism transcriptional regulator
VARSRDNGRKRERILDAAVVEIAQHGYYQTTVAMIARRAGVADGTIYLYFPSKEQILVSVFDRAMDRFIEEGRRQVEQKEDARAKLRHIVELHLDLVGRDRDLADIFQSLFSNRRIREYLEIIAGVVAEGQRSGVFRPGPDPLLTAKAVFGVLDEMATDWILSSRNSRLASKAAAVTDLLLTGLRA